MTTPTLGAALTHALEAGRNLGPRGMPVTLERVTQVFEDGRVEVKGVRIPVTGSGGPRGVRAGQMIAVSWQRGQPVVAIRHSARRTGPVSPQPPPQGSIVEELILGPPATGSVARDYYFRNHVAFGRLGINTAIGSDLQAGVNMWGLSRQHVLVQRPFDHYYVFTLGEAGAARDPERILTDVPIATLAGDYNLRASTLVLGQYTTLYSSFTFNPPIVLGTLLTSGYSSGDGGVRYLGVVDDAMVDERGHLLISVRVIVNYKYSSVLPNWITAMPYIVDMTDGVILYDGSVLAAGQFGVTTHSPVSIDIDALPMTAAPPPQDQVLDPFGSYTLLFLNAAAGGVTVLAGAVYRWAVAGAGGIANPPLLPVATKFMVLTPTSSVVTQAFAHGADNSSPTDGVLLVQGFSAEYVLWVPFTSALGFGGLQSFLPTGAVASLVQMTRFVAPTETRQVAAELDAFFTPRLQLLDPTAFYTTVDDNETGHFFVEYLGPDGGLALDAAAAGFPLKDSRAGEQAGALLAYPTDLAFLETFLANAVAGESAVDAFLSLADLTSYQVILDTSAVRELPI